jgi:hypothetical protein
MQYLILNIVRLLVCIVSNDQLLEPKERAFVIDLLADLRNSPPGMIRVELLTLVTLLVGNDELDNKLLLQDHAVEHLQVLHDSVSTPSVIMSTLHRVIRRTSFCTVNLTLRRRECGSVHTHEASINLTLLRPLIFFKPGMTRNDKEQQQQQQQQQVNHHTTRSNSKPDTSIIQIANNSRDSNAASAQ